MIGRTVVHTYVNNCNDVPEEFVENYFINNNIEFEYYVDTIKESEEDIK